MNECQKCKLWDKAAKEAGKAGGMCQECFDKNYVHFEGKNYIDSFDHLNEEQKKWIEGIKP